MPSQSSSSVRVTWLDRERVVRSVKRAVMRLAAAHPEIQRVVLFGSMARGEAVPGSDVDLLLVLSESRERFLDRAVRYWPSGISVGVDVFAYTEKELASMVQEGNWFAKRALAEGVVIYERNDQSAAGR